MRVTICSGALALAVSIVAAAPGFAQDGPTMWCQASADNGAETTVYYSAFFSAQSYEAVAKAGKFKAEAAEAEESAATVTAKCTAAAGYDQAVAGRNAAMKAAPGTVIDWAG